MNKNSENLISNDIRNIMEEAYMGYSASVIINRALPDSRDGLKPVQRRILYAMYKENLLHNNPYDKCAGIVGEVLKNFHPHGDSSVYDALVRLAQPWIMRFPLINPQGNFGSIDGDTAAAYRYTECKLTEISEELLKNIHEETVDFIPNYKESILEPSVLPAAFPNLLLNGSSGIAVGMTTNIPPHNLNEIFLGVKKVIENPLITIEELMKYILGPDFPTGGIIIGQQGIIDYLSTGKGILKVRGKTVVEENTNGKIKIIINEIPYNINRSNLVTNIANLIQDKVLEEVNDLRDESTEKTRIVIELKKGTCSDIVLNKLYKNTSLETSFGVIMVSLVNKRPKRLNIKEMLEIFIEYRSSILYKKTSFRLKKAEHRLSILKGYLIILENLNECIEIIKSSVNKKFAIEKLISRFPDLNKEQINSILEIKFYNLTSLERDKIKTEYSKLELMISEYKYLLENKTVLLNLLLKDLEEFKDKYGKKRLTSITKNEEFISKEDTIYNKGCLISVSHKGYIKRTDVETYKTQKRGGKGVKNSYKHENDFVEHVFSASTHDYIMFFTNSGRVYIEKVYNLPEGSRVYKGKSIYSIINIKDKEYITGMVCFQNFDKDQHLVMVTKKGIIKKTSLFNYKNYRKDGLIGIKIDNNDELVNVKWTSGKDDLFIITRKGISIRFSENDLRNQGRATRGVKAIKLKDNDYIKSIEVVNSTSTLLIVGEKGQGKKTKYQEYKRQKRGGIGIIAIKDAEIAGAISVNETDEIMLLTKSGKAVRTTVKDIRITGRNTKGVKLININKNDKLMGVSKVIEIP